MKQPNGASKGNAVTATLRKRWLAGIAAAGALSAMFALAPNASAHGDGQGAKHDAQGVAQPHHKRGDGEKRMAQRVERVFAEVGASDEQKARAREIVQASMAEMKALRATPGEGMTEMRTLLSAETIDRNRIEQHRAARHTRSEQMSKLMTRTLADLAEVLTPAQRSEAAKSLTRMGGGHHGRHHHGQHGHDDGLNS